MGRIIINTHTHMSTHKRLMKKQLFETCSANKFLGAPHRQGIGSNAALSTRF